MSPPSYGETVRQGRGIAVFYGRRAKHRSRTQAGSRQGEGETDVAKNSKAVENDGNGTE